MTSTQMIEAARAERRRLQARHDARSQARREIAMDITTLTQLLRPVNGQRWGSGSLATRTGRLVATWVPPDVTTSREFV